MGADANQFIGGEEVSENSPIEEQPSVNVEEEDQPSGNMELGGEHEQGTERHLPEIVEADP